MRCNFSIRVLFGDFFTDALISIAMKDGEKEMKRTHLFFVNAMILTATSMIANAAGVWFNLYIAERLGSVGMGVYQLILSVYAFAITLASAGIHLAATRLVAEEAVLPQGGRVRSAMRVCLLYSLAFGLGAGALLYAGAPMISAHWLACEEATDTLRVMALTLPILSVSTALGGYFTAVRRVVKPAIAQISEQFLRIVLTVAGLALFFPVSSLEDACLLLAAAAALAEVGSFLIAWLLYVADLHRYPPGGSTSGFTKKLLRIALPVAASSYLRSGLTTGKNLMVPMRLEAGGLGATVALSMFGAVHGVALPVILFPAALLNSFSGLIVPEMAESTACHRNVNRIVEKMMTLNLTVSLGICAILFSFSTELGNAVSHNPDVGVYIRLLAPVAPIMYLDTAVDCMLKGMDEQVAVMRYNVYDALVSLAMVWFFLPIMGIKGYILMVCLSEVFNLALSFHRLIQVTGFMPDWIELVARPLLCAAIAAVCVHTAYMAGYLPRAGAFWNAAATAGATVLLYVPLLWLTGSFRKKSIMPALNA